MAKEDTRLLISVEYFKALQNLDSATQVAANSFVRKMLDNPWNPSLNIEKLNLPDSSLRSARVNRDVRVIISSMENGNTFGLLYIDHHQEAYRWAERKKIGVNEKSRYFEIFDTISIDQEPSDNDKQSNLFSSYSDSKLIQLGLSDIELLAVRSITDNEDLERKLKYFPKNTYEILYFLANGDPFEEVIKLVPTQIQEPAPNSAILSRDFFIIDDEESVEAYQKIVEGEIEQWRVFLHPSQAKLINTDFSGPVKVLGEAGTGKTIVALHRAKRLAQASSARILFTTLTSNLASDIEKNLSLICDLKTKNRIEVANIDSWVLQYLNQVGEKSHVIFQKEADEIWEKTLANVAESSILPIEFYRDEWERIIIEQNISSQEQYRVAQRTGRSFPINRKKREIAWRVFEEYRQTLDANNFIDSKLAIQRTIQLIESGINPPKYTNIIIDEAQDFSASMMKLIRTIGGDDHQNDIFLVGDSRQNIYGKNIVLKKCGILTVGRSFTLKINYRTTDEIRRWALQIISPNEMTDLDGELLPESACLSLLHGKRPSVFSFESTDEENRNIERIIRNWLYKGYTPKSICIAARTKKQINAVKSFLQSAGINTYELKGGPDDASFNEIRIGTMHRIKGMEYDCLILCGVCDGIIPLSSTFSIQDPTKQQELEMQERSLLYVAATRAKRELVVTNTGKKCRYIE